MLLILRLAGWLACLARVSSLVSLSCDWLLLYLLSSPLSGDLCLEVAIWGDELLGLVTAGALGATMLALACCAMLCAIGRVCCAVVAKCPSASCLILSLLSSSVCWCWAIT